jgi:hypothetical protein
MNHRLGWKGSNYQDESSSETVDRTFNVEIMNLAYSNPNYSLDFPNETCVPISGWSVIGRLTPKDKSLPSFLIRWDEKHNHVNVDMTPKKRGWEKETNGYTGHTLHQAKQFSGRSFALVIKIPEFDVIDAVISFNLARSNEFRAMINIRSTFSGIPFVIQKNSLGD